MKNLFLMLFLLAFGAFADEENVEGGDIPRRVVSSRSRIDRITEELQSFVNEHPHVFKLARIPATAALTYGCKFLFDKFGANVPGATRFSTGVSQSMSDLKWLGCGALSTSLVSMLFPYPKTLGTESDEPLDSAATLKQEIKDLLSQMEEGRRSKEDDISSRLQDLRNAVDSLTKTVTEEKNHSLEEDLKDLRNKYEWKIKVLDAEYTPSSRGVPTGGTGHTVIDKNFKNLLSKACDGLTVCPFLVDASKLFLGFCPKGKFPQSDRSLAVGNTHPPGGEKTAVVTYECLRGSKKSEPKKVEIIEHHHVDPERGANTIMGILNCFDAYKKQ